jgi:hypothetical protein
VDQFRLAGDRDELENGLNSTCNCSESGWHDCCDQRYDPPLNLYGLQSECVAGALSWQQLQDQLLREGRHPIIFGWELNGGGIHYVVAVRYKTTSNRKKVGIWDPLPVETVVNGVKKGGNAYLISYNNYAGLSNYMGLSTKHWYTYVDVTDQQNGLVLSLVGGAPPPTPFSSATRGVQASRAIDETRQLAATALADADLPNLPEASGPIAGTPGFPFPVVALSLSKLRKTGSNPVGSLLKRPMINVVLYPVESRGKVIDNFLMIRSKTTWLQGGYANLTVTRSLVELRKKAMPSNDDERSRFYLLSVPALGGFLLGHGTGSGARLMSTADLSSAIRGRVWHPANKVLKVLIAMAKGYKLPKVPLGRPR